MPRQWFSPAYMLEFLIKHRTLKDYEHIHFHKRPDGHVTFSWDVPMENQCDYFWSEVKAVLEILVA
jgi:hypothetical protein